MAALLQSQIAFHLTGKLAGTEPAQSADACPALLARYRNLDELRYDFPLVLLQPASEKSYVQCLSGLIDDVAHAVARDEDADRLTRHLLRLEREIRVLSSNGEDGSLAQLWRAASDRLTTHGDELLKDSLKRARGALKIDGVIAPCDARLPAALIHHAWSVVQARKTGALAAKLSQLVVKLSEILAVDVAHSAAACNAASLKASIGGAHADVFDFDLLSKTLSGVTVRDNLPAARRRRIESLLQLLNAQRFFALPGRSGSVDAYSFAFESCTAALAAYRERLPQAVRLAKAIAVAELEIDGEYREAAHDPLFKDFGAGSLGQEELSHFPDYLVTMTADRIPASESDALMEMLSAGLPVKVLVQTDDLLEASASGGDGHFTPGMRAKQLANMAIGLNDVYVVQTAASNLFQFRERVLKGMAYQGAALFSVYSGANGGTLPPYLNAAAAMESRAFPAYCYDPSAGPNWASRFYLDGNPQLEADWPVNEFTYEDANHQRVRVETAFTFVDFVACDPRHAKHFARVPAAQWNADMVPAADHLKLELKSAPTQVPYITIVDRANKVERAIVDDRLTRAALRCRESWHSLQELGGIHNSHAERLLAKEKKSWEEQVKSELAARAPAAGAPVPAAAAVDTATQAPVAEPEEKKSTGEAYIETPRCTTCNECTQLNDKMFAYNEDKQAYIKDPDAGTYAQLVDAAESCQVSIIHPGKPRNPNEPGVDELIARAALFD